MKNPIQRAAVVAGAVAALLVSWAVTVHATPAMVQTTVNEQTSANRAAAASQAKINTLDDETQTMLGDYRATLRETESLRRYNEQLELQIKSQNEEIVSITQQIEEIERTNREIYPLMQRMIETMDQFVKLDVPFLLQERTERVANMKAMMNRADVSTAEKYRRILEAYTIEMEYGRTLEAYEGKLGEGDKERTVNFLRIGRSALMYQTLDGDETGYWDTDKKEWVEDNGYDDDVAHGLKVARKAVAPDLLIAPVRAPEAAAQQEKK
jgi:septal ring factor EnvC (AmiA/AmiB activator)